MPSYTANLNLTKPDGDEEINVFDINGNMDTIDAAVAAESIFITITGMSALPYTYSDSKITASHRMVDFTISNSAAMLSDWGYTTSSGSITLTGTISATTNVTLHLIKTY